MEPGARKRNNPKRAILKIFFVFRLFLVFAFSSGGHAGESHGEGWGGEEHRAQGRVEPLLQLRPAINPTIPSAVAAASNSELRRGGDTDVFSFLFFMARWLDHT